MVKKKFTVLMSTVITFFAISVFFVSPVSASVLPIHGEGYLYDTFQYLTLQPDEDAYWYALNWGDENGQPMIWNDRNCGDASCIEIKGSVLNRYARLRIMPDTTPGFYSNAELAERNTGFATTEPGKYVPTLGHPVLISARVRWSANYNADGSGDNIGSSGLWMWNSPYDDSIKQYGYTEAFGFVMATGEDNFIIPGFAATQSGPSQFPNYVQTIRDIDIHSWVVLSMKWSQVNSTQQKVEYFVGTDKIGETTFDAFGPLDLEIWQDNQTFNAETFEIEFPSPVADQYMDLDYVSVVTL